MLKNVLLSMLLLSTASAQEVAAPSTAPVAPKANSAAQAKGPTSRTSLEGLVDEMMKGFDKQLPYCPVINEFLVQLAKHPDFIPKHDRTGYVLIGSFRARRQLVNGFAKTGESCEGKWREHYRKLRSLEDELMLHTTKFEQRGYPTILQQMGNVWNPKILKSPGMKAPVPYVPKSGDVVLIRRLVQTSELLRFFTEPDPGYNSSGIIHLTPDGKIHLVTVDQFKGLIVEDFFHYVSLQENLPYELTFLRPNDPAIGEKASTVAYNLAKSSLRRGYDHNYDLQEKERFYPAKFIFVVFGLANPSKFKLEDFAVEARAKEKSVGAAILRAPSKKIIYEPALLDTRQFELVAEWSFGRAYRTYQIGAMIRAVMDKPLDGLLARSSFNVEAIRELWPKRFEEATKKRLTAMGVNVAEFKSIQNADGLILNLSLDSLYRDCRIKVSAEDGQGYARRYYLPLPQLEAKFLTCLKL